MALASLPSFGSHFSSDSCLRFDSVSYCRMKSIYLGVGGFGCEGSPRFGCHVHVKDASFPVSLRHCRSNVSSVCKTQNNVVRCEMGHTVKEPLVGGESGVPTGPKLEVSPGSGKGNLSMGKELGASDMTTCLHHDNGNGSGDSSGGNGEFPPGGGGSGGGGDGDDNDRQGENDEHDDEFGPMLKFEEVMEETKARGVNLPPDMYEAAKTMGIQKIFLDNYLSLQELAWPLGAAIRWCPFLRNRMLADRQFLFKIGTEIVIDSCCATFAEVQKRGKDFWAEFELYAADLLVGVVVNIALVSLLAPYARIVQPSTSKGLFSRMARVCGALPSSVFEAERPGCRFSVQQRIGTYFYKGVLYGSVGFVCGIIGQGIANMIMTAKRSVNKSEDDIPVPPLVRSAALWGVFLAISSNARYQIVNGLELMVESSPVARRVPPVAMAFTVGVRFANNIYGGMQFVDWARWSGCQ